MKSRTTQKLFSPIIEVFSFRQFWRSWKLIRLPQSLELLSNYLFSMTNNFCERKFSPSSLSFMNFYYCLAPIGFEETFFFSFVWVFFEKVFLLKPSFFFLFSLPQSIFIDILFIFSWLVGFWIINCNNKLLPSLSTTEK